MKKKICLVSSLAVVIGALILIWQHTQKTVPNKAVITTKIETMDQRQQKKILTQYPQVTEALEKVPTIEQLTPVPGLKQTVTFAVATQQSAICDAMTPQGLAVSGDKIFISAYCHDHQHNSVIYVMDRIKKQMIATIPVVGTPHLGGIMYEQKHNNLWLATENGAHASISAISAKTINRWGNQPPKAPVTYDKVLDLPNIPRASLLSYLDPFLVVGYFDKQAGGELALYPFDRKGNLTSLIEEKNSVEGLQPKNQLVTDDTGTIVKKTQGIAYYQHYMFLAQSYGNHASEVYVIDLEHAPAGFTAASAFKKIKFPPYLEQITVEGDRFYAIFESGAKAYRAKTAQRVDHVLELDTKTLLKNHD
ncbi:hypothetical protein [Enterococcus sp. CSURQ0835]|uniref:hypothetical protein n=1 Tax=Enterococcus sp. CSURQ0835 TaxID=2681394 RepID=UPI00135A0951|nr:hypothetical protein [Enterococcus sp. CSURQ0835]